MRLIDLPLIAFASTLAGTLAAAPSPALAEQPSLARQLRDAAGGKPVLLINQHDKGVVARTVDNSFHRVIAPQLWGVWDPALELLWLFRDGTLCVLDLRLPQPRPVPIVEGLGERRIPVTRANKPPRPGVHLLWTRKPRIAVKNVTAEWFSPIDDVTPEDVVEENERLAARARGARIVGTAWLRDNLDRRPRKTALRSVKFTRKVRAMPGDECRQNTCGRAARVGKSGLMWVVTGEMANHDDAWVVCDIYNPKTRRWAYPRETGKRNWTTMTTGSAGGYSCHPKFDASGTAYLLVGDICGIDTGCSDPGLDSAIGWLDPGIRLVPPKPETRDPWGE